MQISVPRNAPNTAGMTPSAQLRNARIGTFVEPCIVQWLFMTMMEPLLFYIRLWSCLQRNAKHPRSTTWPTESPPLQTSIPSYVHPNSITRKHWKAHLLLKSFQDFCTLAAIRMLPHCHNCKSLASHTFSMWLMNCRTLSPPNRLCTSIVELMTRLWTAYRRFWMMQSILSVR